MGPHGLSLLIDPTGHVDFSGEPAGGLSHGVHPVHGSFRGRPPRAAGLLSQGSNEVPVHGGHVHHRGSGALGGPHPHPVNLHVVRMAVSAMLVIGHQHVGSLRIENGRHGTGRLLDVSGGEAPRSVVAGLTGHAGIEIVQKDLAMHAQDPACLGQFLRSALCQRLGRSQQAFGNLAELTARRRDQHHPVTLVGKLGHGAAGGDGLIVGMGVEEDNGGHFRHPTAAGVTVGR